MGVGAHGTQCEFRAPLMLNEIPQMHEISKSTCVSLPKLNHKGAITITRHKRTHLLRIGIDLNAPGIIIAYTTF